jgi:hypothetical protein
VKEWQIVVGYGIEVSGGRFDSGHYIPEEEPDVVAQSTMSFLR